MSLLDYLLMKPPDSAVEKRLGTAEPGKVSGSRIAISLVGLFLGCFFSFFVTGIVINTHKETPVPIQQGDATGEASAHPATSEPKLIPFTLQRAKFALVVSFILTLLSFQTLYFKMKIYQNEHWFLLCCMAFEYGYFLESLTEGVTALAG